MKSKKITIKDVAKEAGVSVATVSRALNGLGGIGKETRDHVLEICERMAYVQYTRQRIDDASYKNAGDCGAGYYQSVSCTADGASYQRGTAVWLSGASLQ